MNAAPSITDTLSSMISQSMQLLSKPSVQTFEQLEDKGKVREAVIYVAAGSVITGLLGLGAGLGGFIAGILTTIIGFLVFTYLIFYIGKSQGGTGSFDQVAYSFSLFYVPVSVVAAVGSLILVITVIGVLLIPALLLAAVAANVYFAYLAVQSSLNLTQSGPIWTTLIVSAIGSFIANFAIANLFS
ncbi:MAG: YIP1 family protein [Meiothermus sp.]|nr:YIP1 family protein [Meiothermus sp.]